MKGLGHAHAGSNPLAQLSLVQDARCDPEYFALNLTLRTFRKHCIPDQAFALLDQLSLQPPVHYAPGPAGVLLTRLHRIGWKWEHGGWLRDHEGIPIHILNTPVQELGSRLQRTWQKEAACRVATRKTFQGMASVCVRTSKKGWDQLTPHQQSLLKVVHNGSFYTQDKHAKSGYAESPKCRWCDQVDSVEHRMWKCPATCHLRSQCPQGLEDELRKEPQCTQQHAWFCEPPEGLQFREALQQIPQYQQVPWESPELPETLHLFTDGSCLAPSDARVRLASWAVILALPDEDQFRPLVTGLVPGQHQTGGRGELIAAIQAFRFAEYHQKSFCLWTDYERVLRLFDTWEMQDDLPTAWKHDHDLQQELFVRYKLAMAQQRLIKVVHITSHLSPMKLSSAVEFWARRGNEAADQWAAQACQDGPRGLHDARKALLQANQRLDWMQEHSKQLHLRLAAFALNAAQPGGENLPARRQRREDQAEDAARPFAFAILRQAKPEELVQLEPEEDSLMVQWLASFEQNGATGKWLTWHHLVIDYQMCTGSLGPWQKPGSRKWQRGADWSSQLQDYSLREIVEQVRHAACKEPRGPPPNDVSPT